MPWKPFISDGEAEVITIVSIVQGMCVRVCVCVYVCPCEGGKDHGRTWQRSYISRVFDVATQRVINQRMPLE